ncbi:MAG: serine protease [Caulobacterales bacterium]
MHFPRLPDWLVYLSIVLALLFAALGRRERANSPLPPPPLPAGEGAVINGATPFDPAVVIKVAGPARETTGTAFSVADSGVWLTARHVVDGCAKAAIMVNDTQGVEAKIQLDPLSETAVLTTAGGAPALPLAPVQPLRRGAQAFHPGFPQGRPGEVASRLLGRETLFLRGRLMRTVPVLVWAEVGRTDGLKGVLIGISGAPALDGEGRVIGVTVAEAPRRGRIFTTTPETVRAAMALAGARPSPQAAGEPITTDNYGPAADNLRRDLRVAPVVCLTR